MTTHGRDEERLLDLTYQIWHPAGPNAYPLVIYSHFSGGDRLSATYLCEHIAACGYVVAAIDHSERALPRPSATEDERDKAARMQRLIASRVPDLQFLLDAMLRADSHQCPIEVERIGAVGHSFGGWAVLAAPSVERRIRAVVALAPAGASNPRPGIIPAELDFAWTSDVATLIIAGEADTSLSVAGIREIYDRTPGMKRLVILHGVDHVHFVDDARNQHERVRTMDLPAELAYLREEMRPFSELRDEAETHAIVAALTVAHFDATLKGRDAARDLLAELPLYV